MSKYLRRCENCGQFYCHCKEKRSAEELNQIKHLRRYVEYCGPMHDVGCPGDDTCSCSWKVTMDAIEEMIKE